MIDFLTGNDVHRVLELVLLGSNLSCAVSSWNHASAKLLRDIYIDRNETRVVCDVSTGGCTPEALLELGAPQNCLLRHRVGLNATVWISDSGALIGSAAPHGYHAGKLTPAGKVLEVATFHRTGSAVWRAAINWFDRLYDEAKILDIEAMELAAFNCSPAIRSSEWSLPDKESLFDFLMRSPEQFVDVGFAVISGSTTERERSEARHDAIERMVENRDFINRLPAEGIIVGVEKKDVTLWPDRFIDFRFTGDKLKIIPRVVCAKNPDYGTLFTRRDPRLLARLISDGCPSLHEARSRDFSQIRLLRKDRYALFISVSQLSQTVDATKAE